MMMSGGVAAGCGSSSGGQSGPRRRPGRLELRQGGGQGQTASPVSLAQLPTLIAQTICDQNFKCTSMADIVGRMESDCVSTNMTAWQFIVGSVDDGETAGRLAYDAATRGTGIAKLASET
jgi:hypothetical protein